MTPEEKKTWTDYYAKRTKSLVDGMKSGKLKDPKAFAEWKWHAYMEDYLGCLLSVDDSIGRLMEYLDKRGLRKTRWSSTAETRGSTWENTACTTSAGFLKNPSACPSS